MDDAMGECPWSVLFEVLLLNVIERSKLIRDLSLTGPERVGDKQ